MAKYFSTHKTQKNGYVFADLALYLSYLKGANQMFGSDDYKIMIRNAAILFADKSRAVYLDLSMLIDRKNGCWNTKLFSASEFLKEINQDIYHFVQERAKENSERER